MAASATLITADDLRERFGIVADIGAERLRPAIRAAARRLRGWVSAEVYTDALLLVEQNETPTNEDRAYDLQDAEAALSMHYLILNLNTNITPGGVVLQAKEDGNVTIQYASPAQTRDLAEQYLNQAEELARAWSLTDGTPDVQFALI